MMVVRGSWRSQADMVPTWHQAPSSIRTISITRCLASELITYPDGSTRPSGLGVHASQPGVTSRAAPMLTLFHRSRSEDRSRMVSTSALALPSTPLVQSNWGIWAALACTGAAALHLERTQWGKKFNAPLLATVLGLALSNLGVIPAHAPEIHGVINAYLLPLAVPMLLLSANISKVLSTGRLLVCFSFASLATVLGSFLACAVIPLNSMGLDGYKVAAALTARHIGGSINFVAVTELLGVSASSRMAALAADDLIVTPYFILLYGLARAGRTKPSNSSGRIILEGYEDESPSSENDRMGSKSISILHGATALGLGALLCSIGSALASHLGYKGGSIAIVTFLTVIFASVAPRRLLNSTLISSGEGLGYILLQIFFASVGASGSISVVLQTAPKLFVWSLIGVVTHLLLMIVFEKVFRFERREMALSSNAAMGGPATAASMAATLNWQDFVVPGILIGIFGYTIGTPIGMAAVPVIKSIFEWRLTM